jgi:hypothetical protein
VTPTHGVVGSTPDGACALSCQGLAPETAWPCPRALGRRGASRAIAELARCLREAYLCPHGEHSLGWALGWGALAHMATAPCMIQHPTITSCWHMPQQAWSQQTGPMSFYLAKCTGLYELPNARHFRGKGVRPSCIPHGASSMTTSLAAGPHLLLVCQGSALLLRLLDHRGLVRHVEMRRWVLQQGAGGSEAGR